MGTSLLKITSPVDRSVVSLKGSYMRMSQRIRVHKFVSKKIGRRFAYRHCSATSHDGCNDESDKVLAEMHI